MKKMLLLFVLLAALLPVGPAQAEPAHRVEAIIRALAPGTKVPPEWDGIWQTIDSVFACTGGLQSASTGYDTLCGGKDIPAPGGFNYTCTGTADATSIHLTCTWDYAVMPDCQANSVTVIDGTLSGDSFSYVATNNITYSGTGFGCNLLPPYCSVVHVHGTWTGPAPEAYCASATLPASWGKIKEYYR